VVKEQKERGIAGDAQSVQRTLSVTMSDKMRSPPIVQGQDGLMLLMGYVATLAVCFCPPHACGVWVLHQTMKQII